MKNKVFVLLAALLSCVMMLAGCKIVGGDEKPSENFGGTPIYSSDSTLGIRYGEEVYSCEEVADLYNNFYAVTNVVKLDKNSTPMEHEIVLGVSNLDVSTEAYRRLARMSLDSEQENNPDEYTRCLIYSDGKSVAIAFDEQIDFISLRIAIDYVAENLVSESLTLESGTVFSAITNIYEFYEAEDEIILEREWATLSSVIGENGAEVVDSMKDLYSIYSDDLISWMANLYEPDICVCAGECEGTENCIGGGFYFSNSARNTIGYLPNIESTKQVFDILKSSGMTENWAEALPDNIVNDVVRWVKSLQAEDGYFYHPQWGTNIYSSRRNRDLSAAVNILKAAGARPTYTTPTGIAGDGVKPTSARLAQKIGTSVVNAVSNVVAVSGVTDPNLEDNESFIAYLESLDVKNNSYSAGNTLAAYIDVIKARDKELEKEGKNYSLFDIMIEYLNSTQNPTDGTWYWVDKASSSYSLYTAVNGLMKISCVYADSQEIMPNADKALETAMAAITHEKDVTAAVDIYNTWFAINNILKIYKNVGGQENLNKIKEIRALLIQNAESLISATKAKLVSFKKDDGSFSYNVKYSASTAQGSLIAVPNTEEGDLDGTKICTVGTVQLIYSCLGADDYSVPIYTKSDMYRFVNIIDDLGRVVKDEFENVIEVDSFENYGNGKYKNEALDFEKLVATELLNTGSIGTDKPDELFFDSPASHNNVSVYEVESGDSHTKALHFKKFKKDMDPYLLIFPQSTGAKSYVFEADVCIMGGNTNFSDNQVLSFYFYNDETIYGSRHLTATGMHDDEGHAIYGTGVENLNVITSVWYNFRIEYQNIETVGGESRFYVNNELVERKYIAKSADALTHLALRFRMDSGAGSIALLDNVYFSAIDNLEFDTTPLIPPIDIQEIPNASEIDSQYRGSGVYYDKAVNYSDTNATLLDINGYIGTNGLDYDLKNTEAKNYLKVASINGDAVLDFGKHSGATDKWLRILQTEKRSGDSYVFETDFVLAGGLEWRKDDNNLFGFYLAQDNADTIFWGGARGVIRIIDGEYVLFLPDKNAEGNQYEGTLDANKWYNLRIELSGINSGSTVKYYINSELIHTTSTNGSISAVSHMLFGFTLDATGQMYLDNTYFAGTGELLPDVSDTPDTPSDPEDQIPTYERGNGANNNNSDTLTFTDITASALGSSGKLVVNGLATLDGEKMSASVVEIDGDSALKLDNNVRASEGFLNIKTDKVGNKYVFETDMMIGSGSSSRSAREILQIFGSDLDNGNGTFGSSGIPGIRLKAIPENGVTTYAITNGTEIIKNLEVGEWFNVRYEFEDWS